VVSRRASGPVALSANTVPSFYPGAGRIGAWRGVDGLVPTDPEDWVASTQRRTGMGERGLTVLPDGGTLAAAVEAEPEAWLGPEQLRRRGATTGMLLKLLDAGCRLPVHVHPSDAFARAHLGQPNGKAEAWLVLHAEPGATVHLGFRRAVGTAELSRWVTEQDVPALLAELDEVPVQAGDVLWCPPGVPHAIGADVLVIEIQQPSDTSIMLEWDGFPIDPADRFFGLDEATALAAVDRSGYGGAGDAPLAGRRLQPLATAEAGVVSLLPPDAGTYFTVEQVVARSRPVELDVRFAVLFVLEGEGALSAGTGAPATASVPTPVRGGETWLLPWAAGPWSLAGPLSAVRCSAV